MSKKRIFVPEKDFFFSIKIKNYLEKQIKFNFNNCKKLLIRNIALNLSREAVAYALRKKLALKCKKKKG